MVDGWERYSLLSKQLIYISVELIHAVNDRQFPRTRVACRAVS
jgi:hypothetical protein